MTALEKEPWDLEEITLFIGGYNSSARFFHGCLSDVVFDGVDIIEKYFVEYPNNLNPSRGPLVIGNFSNMPEICEHSKQPTTMTSKTIHTTELTTASSSSSQHASTTYFIQYSCVFIMSIPR